MTVTSRGKARFLWAAVSVEFVETIITGFALVPAALYIHWQSTWPLSTWIRLTLASLGFAPVCLVCTWCVPAR